MVLRMSTLFLRTLRDNPADADVPSHALLMRAGMVRRTAAGIYTWLPLGYRVLRNVERVVREEMDRMGAQEVHFPALLPREPYETTGRWTEYGDGVFRVKDRRGGDYMLGPTHEEFFTLLVKSEYSSYKDLPVSLYQIQNKYRDESRPRAGVLRGREFVMKDSYSFDVDDAGLQTSYDQHRDAYIRTFDRLGLDYRIVSAVSGAMGGSASEEFLALSPVGEDTFVACTSCQYAANIEALRIAAAGDRTGRAPAAGGAGHPEHADHRDPRGAARCAGLGTLKNLLVKVVQPDGKTELVAIGVPGDREVDLRRLAAAMEPATVEMVEAADFADRPDLVRGYVGPQGLAGKAFTYYADPRVATGTAWVTGANQTDKHAKNVVAGRDFEVDEYLDVAEVRDGDPCPRCGGGLVNDRAIEIGHIFQLGRKYADAFGLDVLGQNGKPVRVTMGSYGIGVSRAVAAIAEQHHDDKGLLWPREIAPADVHVVAAGKGDQIAASLKLGDELEAAGLRVLVDDRAGVSPGVKFTDSELLGIPTIVVVGRGLADGIIEVKDRATGERIEIQLTDAVAHLTALATA